MEYLTNFNDQLKTISEKNIKYLDLFDYPEFFYGTSNYMAQTLDTRKFPQNIHNEMKIFGNDAYTSMNLYNYSTSGVRLRFKTNSPYVIFKIELLRKYGFQKLVNWNAMGFDVYSVDNDKYIHETVFAPSDGHNIFAYKLKVPKNGQICIFLPNYNVIKKFHMGLSINSTIETLEYPKNNRLPIIFYGNSITQGASASRSGNSFPNMVSKLKNQDIINLSTSFCCRGTEKTAEFISKLNFHTLVIDYTRNADTTKIFSETYDKFYRIIRKNHPTKKIILMTSSSFNHSSSYDMFDKIVSKTYEEAIKRGENTKMINQKDLFDKKEYSYVTVDQCHYTDYGMLKIAKKICELIND